MEGAVLELMGVEGRLSARRSAPFHVQLELATLPTPRMPTRVHIEGRVVRIFRGDASLQLGAHVSFPLWICERGDEPTGPAYVYYKELSSASHMEAYLYGTPSQCDLAAYEFVLLDRASSEASMGVQDLEKLLEPEGLINSLSESRAPQTKWYQIWRR